jgi:hypothetical protein
MGYQHVTQHWEKVRIFWVNNFIIGRCLHPISRQKHTLKAVSGLHFARQQGTDEIVSLERRFSRCTALGPPSARACNVYAGEEHSRGVCLLLLVIRSGGGSAVVGSGG